MMNLYSSLKKAVAFCAITGSMTVAIAGNPVKPTDLTKVDRSAATVEVATARIASFKAGRVITNPAVRFEEDQLIEINVHNRNGGNSAFDVNTVQSNEWTDGNITRQQVDTIIGGNNTPVFENLFTYSGDNVTLMEQNLHDGSAYQPSTKTEYTYDGDNVITEVFSTYDGSAFAEAQITSYEYNGDLVSKVSFEVPVDGAMTLIQSIAYEYNGSDLETKSTDSRLLQNGEFVVFEEITSTYTGENLTGQLTQTANIDTVLANNTRYTAVYSGDDVELEEFETATSETDWCKYIVFTHTYPNGTHESVLTLDIAIFQTGECSGTMSPFQKTIETFNSLDLVETTSIETPDESGAFAPSNQSRDVYNERENLVKRYATIAHDGTNYADSTAATLNTYIYNNIDASSVANFDNNFESTLYPNPVNSVATLNFDMNAGEVYTLAVFNAAGQLVKSVRNVQTNYALNVANIANGIYTFKLFSNASVSTGTFSVVK